MFLTDEELQVLTGRKFRSYQIEALRKMAIPFWINAVGRPIVARSTIEGRKQEAPPIETEWIPNVLKDTWSAGN